MTTTGQYLASLSGLPPGSAARAHLVAVAGQGGPAAGLLVLRSGLPTGSALQHLLAIRLVDYVDAPAGAGYVRSNAQAATRPLIVTGSRDPEQPTTRSAQSATIRPAETQATRSPSQDSSRPAPAATVRPLQANTTRR